MEVFEKMGAKAAMTIPIEVHAETGMYLCFYETEKERIWESADIKFIHDAKQVLQSILARRVASNSLAKLLHVLRCDPGKCGMRDLCKRSDHAKDTFIPTSSFMRCSNLKKTWQNLNCS